jgi:hypothetical protein
VLAFFVGSFDTRHHLLGVSHTPRFPWTGRARSTDTDRVRSRCYSVFLGSLGGITLLVALFVSFVAVSTTTEAGAPGDATQAPASRSAQVRSVRASTTTANSIAPSIAPALRLAAQTPAGTPRQGPTSNDFTITTVYSEPSPDEPAAPAAPVDAPPDRTISTVGPIDGVNITFYDCASQGFCGPMYNGEWVYEGAAACSWDLALGTAFRIEGDPTQRVYVCKDRGMLTDTWVDIFWYHPADGYYWQSFVGRHGTIDIVYVP